MFIDFKERKVERGERVRKEERQKNISVTERHRSVASIHAPTGDRTHGFLVYGMALQPNELCHWSHL